MTTLAMARPRQGTVGERERMVHLFDAHHRAANGDLIALCNKRFNPVDLESIHKITGMPCEICVSLAPHPTHYRERIQLESGSDLNHGEDREPQSNVSFHDDVSSPDEPKRQPVLELSSASGETSEWNSRRFDPDSDPLRYRYQLLADHLARMISIGQIPPNKPLPAERRLAAEYGVSLATARRATDELRLRGLVVTLRSKGTYVLPSVAQPDRS